LRLSATRGGGFGPGPITFQEIAAWKQVMRLDPEPWEIEIILMLDAIWFEVYAEREKEQTPAC